MTAPLDVLAVLDFAVARAGGSQHAHLKQARTAVADLIKFNRSASSIAMRIVGARTESEAIEACREMAKLYNDDLDAALANAGASA